MGIPPAFIQSAPKVHTFGENRRSIIGKAKFQIPYGDNRRIKIVINIIDIVISLFLGLDVLDKCKLIVDTVVNRMGCNDSVLSAPTTQSLNHRDVEAGN